MTVSTTWQVRPSRQDAYEVERTNPPPTPRANGELVPITAMMSPEQLARERSGVWRQLMKSQIAWMKASGCSSGGQCPHFGISTYDAPGILSASSRHKGGGVAASSSPQTTRVGLRTEPS